MVKEQDKDNAKRQGNQRGNRVSSKGYPNRAFYAVQLLQ